MTNPNQHYDDRLSIYAAFIVALVIGPKEPKAFALCLLILAFCAVIANRLQD